MLISTQNINESFYINYFLFHYYRTIMSESCKKIGRIYDLHCYQRYQKPQSGDYFLCSNLLQSFRKCVEAKRNDLKYFK